MSYSKTILIGKLGRDPETTYSGAGLAIVKFSLATTETVKKEKQTSWHRCVAFGKTAETIEKYCKKGSKLLVDCRIQYGQYEKDGRTIYTTDLIVNAFRFLDSKKDNDLGNNNSATPPEPKPSPPAAYDDDGRKANDDIPF